MIYKSKSEKKKKTTNCSSSFNHPFFWIVGEPGSGKTTLLKQWIASSQEPFTPSQYAAWRPWVIVETIQCIKGLCQDADRVIHQSEPFDDITDLKKVWVYHN